MRLSQSRVSPWEGEAAPCHPSRDPSVPGSRAWCFHREDVHHSGMIHQPSRCSGVGAGNGIQTHCREYKPFSQCCRSLPGLHGRASPEESPSSSQGKVWEGDFGGKRPDFHRTLTLGSFPSLSCPSQTPLGRIPTAQKRGSHEGGCVLLECCSWTPNPAGFPPKSPVEAAPASQFPSDPCEKLHHDPALLSSESWKEMENWDSPFCPDRWNGFLVFFPAVCGR